MTSHLSARRPLMLSCRQRMPTPLQLRDQTAPATMRRIECCMCTLAGAGFSDDSFSHTMHMSSACCSLVKAASYLQCTRLRLQLCITTACPLHSCSVYMVYPLYFAFSGACADHNAVCQVAAVYTCGGCFVIILLSSVLRFADCLIFAVGSSAHMCNNQICSATWQLFYACWQQ